MAEQFVTRARKWTLASVAALTIGFGSLALTGASTLESATLNAATETVLASTVAASALSVAGAVAIESPNQPRVVAFAA